MVIVLINGVRRLYLILRLFIWKYKLKRRKVKKQQANAELLKRMKTRRMSTIARKYEVCMESLDNHEEVKVPLSSLPSQQPNLLQIKVDNRKERKGSNDFYVIDKINHQAIKSVLQSQEIPNLNINPSAAILRTESQNRLDISQIDSPGLRNYKQVIQNRHKSVLLSSQSSRKNQSERSIIVNKMMKPILNEEEQDKDLCNTSDQQQSQRQTIAGHLGDKQGLEIISDRSETQSQDFKMQRNSRRALSTNSLEDPLNISQKSMSHLLNSPVQKSPIDRNEKSKFFNQKRFTKNNDRVETLSDEEDKIEEFNYSRASIKPLFYKEQKFLKKGVLNYEVRSSSHKIESDKSDKNNSNNHENEDKQKQEDDSVIFLL